MFTVTPLSPSFDEEEEDQDPLLLEPADVRVESPNVSFTEPITRWLRRSALVLVLVLCFTIGYLLHNGKSGRTVNSLDNPAAQSSLPDNAPASATTSVVETIVVDIHGDVARPGVYKLPVNSRVQDAVVAAGGYRHEEDATEVNAAAVLDDGGEVVIPAVLPTAQGDQASQPTAARGNSTVAAVATGNGLSTPGGKIDVNTATAESLETLPGIGPQKAQQIIQYRNQHGVFHRAEDLLQVPGIGPSTVEKLSPYLEFGH